MRWVVAGLLALSATPGGAEEAGTAFETRLRAAPPGEGLRECEACPELLALPGGSFLMGSPDDEPGRLETEGPRRRVTLRPFAIGRFEVAFAEWDACVAAGGCDGYAPPDRGRGRGRLPVFGVSWLRVQAYLDWLNSTVAGAPYRLPSEAEWEYAARAGAQTAYPWGDAPDPARLSPVLAPVGSRPPNAFGLQGAHGDVAEWVADCWRPSYQGAPSDGSAWREASEEDCGLIVLRGGAYNDAPALRRSASRMALPPELGASNLGFRVVREMQGE